METLTLNIVLIESFLLGMKLVFAKDAFIDRKSHFVHIWWERQVYIFVVCTLATGIIVYYLGLNDLALLQYLDIVITFLLIAAVDVKHKRVPNTILICFFGGQLIYSIMNVPPIPLVWNMLIGLAVFGSLMLISFLTNGKLGMGDAKLIGIMAAFSGGIYTLKVVFLGLIGICIVSIVLLAMKKINLKSELPFVPFLALGVIAQFIMTII